MLSGLKSFLQIPCPDDGVLFDTDTLKAVSIVAHADHVGVRIKVTGFLGNIRQQLQLDIGFGDVVRPKPYTRDYPVLLGMVAPNIWVYSLESVIAEKFEAMIRLSVINSRMKDFYDIFTLLRIELGWLSGTLLLFVQGSTIYLLPW